MSKTNRHEGRGRRSSAHIPADADIGNKAASLASRLHRGYVRVGTAFASAIRDPAVIAAMLAKCEIVNDGKRCELLRFEKDDPWCSACGCPTALKRGCPKKKW